jgi:hypothetical protein
MELKHFIVIAVFVIRMFYDMFYLYNDCFTKVSKNVFIYSFLHSLVFTLVFTGWFLDIRICLLAILTAFLIYVTGKIFKGCILTIAANKLCGDKVKQKFYIDPTLYNAANIILVFLYAIRIYRYLKNMKY